MDRERFRSLVSKPERTQAQLEQMLQNAVAKKETELAEIVRTALERRFPEWDRKKRKNSGATATLARFKDDAREFSTAKEAYIWIMDCFIKNHPEALTSEDWMRDFIAKGRAADYFARELKSLFRRSPHLASDPNNYTILGNGWYANLNLSNRQKFEILCKFSAVAEYKFGIDWDWKVQDHIQEEMRRPLRDLLT